MKHLRIAQLSLLFLCLLTFLYSSAGNEFQTIRGTVVDQVSKTPLFGVSVIIPGSDPLIGTVTDLDGKFELNQVPLGKYTLQFSMVGYETVIMNDLSLTAAKELVLEVSMKEKAFEGAEATVTATVDKNRPQNEMLTVSSRTFSVEETQKYAAAVNDPLRMSLAFAGVVTTDDGNNNISIRGNAPGGLLWRMEGIDVPSPNHFTAPGTSGGGISILSSQLLSNSDFSTGAFSAEYGNALSGVFDLQLRKGNNQKREYTFRAGVLGVDLAAEGPFKKDYAGSYLVNYRYSTLGLLGQMGVNIGDGVTTFQDLSYHVFLPTRKAGSFSLFGFGGLSSQVFEADRDTASWKLDGDPSEGRYHSNTLAGGIKHTYHFNKQHYLKSAFLLSTADIGYKENELDYNLVNHFQYEQAYQQNKRVLSSTLNSKFNAKTSMRSGVILTNMDFNTKKVYHHDSLNKNVTLSDFDGATWLFQTFTQWQHQLNSRWMVQGGLHFLTLALNGSSSLEPRASIRYQINPDNSLSLGYGLHSQMQPLSMYFSRVQDNQGNTGGDVHKGLGLSKAHHLVLAYDRSFGKNWRTKVETYYQRLFNIPVSADPKYQFSVLNNTEDDAPYFLVNEGKGENYGLELTVERFLANDFYLLLSASLFESKYAAVDGSWHDTRFNTGRVVSLTTGKEYQLAEKYKSRIVGWNLKLIYSGGMRTMPIKLEESIADGKPVFDFQNAFAWQNPDYFRADLGLTLKRNYKRSTGTLSLNIQNVSNRSNVGGRYFDQNTGKIKSWYQAPLIPVLSYKLEF